MKIITAIQARENKPEYIKYSLWTIEYVMNQIEIASNGGFSCVCFIKDYTQKEIYNQMLSEKFIKYIESLGYVYRLNSEEDNMGYYEEIEISW